MIHFAMSNYPKCQIDAVVLRILTIVKLLPYTFETHQQCNTRINLNYLCVHNGHVRCV